MLTPARALQFHLAPPSYALVDSDLRRDRVLVVDDAEMVLRSTCAVLKRQYEVTSASSFEHALRALRGLQSLAVALLDWHMPGSCGRLLIAETVKFCPDAYIIILTGDMMHGLVATQWPGPGPHAVLAKPCAPRLILRQVALGAAMHRQRDQQNAV